MRYLQLLFVLFPIFAFDGFKNTGKEFTSDSEGKSALSFQNASENSTENSNHTKDGKCLSLKKGMVSWWPFEDISNDVFGPNQGIPLNGAGVYDEGKVGKAIVLNGDGAYVRIPNSPSLTPAGSFTFEAWIYPTRDELGNLICKWGDEREWSNQRSYIIEFLPGRNLAFAISVFDVRAFRRVLV